MDNPTLCQNLVFNGKFLSAPSTGVQRVGREFIRALTAVTNVTAIAPRRTPLSDIPESCVLERHGWLVGQPWEQIDLPRFTRGRRLVGLCNLAPLRGTGIVMIHDAQTFLTPQSYSPAYVRYYRTLQPLIARNADLVLTVSNYSAEHLIRFKVVPELKIVVLPNGVDHINRAAARQAPLPSTLRLKSHYVVSLANTQAHKNVKILLQAFSLPSLRDVQLVLIGNATPNDFARAGMPVPENTIFPGWLGDEVLATLTAGAICFAFPSLTEGFGLPPMEAMALGCPAVVAPCGALPEVCGNAALYADPHDPAQWAKQVLSLMEPETHAEASNRGQAHAARFTWQRTVERFVKIISQHGFL